MPIVEARTSRLSGTRKIVDVIFYTNRKTDFTEWFVVRFDVTGVSIPRQDVAVP